MQQNECVSPMQQNECVSPMKRENAFAYFLLSIRASIPSPIFRW